MNDIPFKVYQILNLNEGQDTDNNYEEKWAVCLPDGTIIAEGLKSRDIAFMQGRFYLMTLLLQSRRYNKKNPPKKYSDFQT